MLSSDMGGVFIEPYSLAVITLQLGLWVQMISIVN